MAEVLIRVTDKVNSDPELDRASYKAGDVITIQEDGWLWSHEEVNSPHTRVVKVPGVAVDTLVDMVSAEDGPTGNFRRRRLRNFDMTQAFLRTRVGQPGTIITINAGQRAALLALKRDKEPIGDVVG